MPGEGGHAMRPNLCVPATHLGQFPLATASADPAVSLQNSPLGTQCCAGPGSCSISCIHQELFVSFAMSAGVVEFPPGTPLDPEDEAIPAMTADETSSKARVAIQASRMAAKLTTTKLSAPNRKK